MRRNGFCRRFEYEGEIMNNENREFGREIQGRGFGRRNGKGLGKSQGQGFGRGQRMRLRRRDGSCMRDGAN